MRRAKRRSIQKTSSFPYHSRKKSSNFYLILLLKLPTARTRRDHYFYISKNVALNLRLIIQFMKVYELTNDEIALIEASRAGSMLELTPEVGCYETKL